MSERKMDFMILTTNSGKQYKLKVVNGSSFRRLLTEDERFTLASTIHSSMGSMLHFNNVYFAPYSIESVQFVPELSVENGNVLSVNIADNGVCTLSNTSFFELTYGGAQG